MTIGGRRSPAADFEPQLAGTSSGTVGSIPCESYECPPLPVTLDDPGVGTLMPGAFNLPVHFRPRRCPKDRRRVVRNGNVAYLATRHPHKENRKNRSHLHPEGTHR